MHYIEKSRTTVSPAYTLGQRARTALLLAPFSLVGLAGAQTTDPLADLNTKASTGVNGIIATVATVAGIALTIGLIVWGTRHLKPKN